MSQPSVIDNSGNTLTADAISNSTITQIVNQLERRSEILFEQSYSTDPDALVSEDFRGLAYRHIQEHHVFILIGTPAVDKAAVAAHLAWQFGVKHGRPLLQWVRGSGDDARNVLNSIREVQNPSVILLDDISPQNIAYDARRLIETATRGSHWIIASSQQAEEQWKDVTSAHCLYRVPKQDITTVYDPDVILSALLEALTDEREHLPFLPPSLSPDTVLGGLKLGDISRALATPANIRRFLSWLKQPNVKLASLSVEIERWKQDQLGESIIQWFERELKPHEQLIAIAMALLDGLLEDQFFVILDQIADAGWGKRHDELASLDYVDLKNMGGFFQWGEETGYHELRGRFSENRQRGLLLEHALKHYRRHLTEALEVLERVVHDSFSYREFLNTRHGFILYRTPERRRRLRDVITQSLTEISWQAMDVSETVLLRLATDPMIEVQSIAAQSISNWLNITPDAITPQLKLLSNWQNSASINQLMRLLAMITGQIDNTSDVDINALRGTVVLALGTILMRYPSGKYPEAAFKQLSDMTSVVNSHIAKRVIQILPYLVVTHFHDRSEDTDTQRKINAQLIDWLTVLAQQRLLSMHVALSLTLVYTSYPDAVKEVIHKFGKMFDQAATSDDQKQAYAYGRATVAYYYGLISQVELDPSVNITHKQNHQAVLGILSNKRQNEQHPVVRQALLEAIWLHSQKSLGDDGLQSAVENAINNLDAQDFEVFVSLFVSTYIEQRKTMSGGDLHIPVREFTLWVWRNPLERPLTKVEELMTRWLSHKEEKSQIRHIAAICLAVFIINVDAYEQSAIESYEREQARKQLELDAQQRRIGDSIHQITGGRSLSDWLQSMAGSIFKFFQSEYAHAVKGISAALENEKISAETRRFLLQRLKALRPDNTKRTEHYRDVVEIAKQVEKTFQQKGK